MARRRVRVKPGRAQSAMGFFVGIVFVLIGLFTVIPSFGLFGLLWTGLFRTADHAGSAGYALFVIAAVYLGCTAIDLARERLVMQPIRGSRWFAALCRRGDETLGALDKIFPDR